MVYRAHADIGLIISAPQNGRVDGSALRLADQIYTAAGSREGWVAFGERRLRGSVHRKPYARFPQIVPCCPVKISDHIVIFQYGVPVGSHAGWKCLAGQDHPLRELFMCAGIQVVPVVVAHNIHRFCAVVDNGFQAVRGDGRHDFGQKRHNIIDLLAAHRFTIALFLGCLLRFHGSQRRQHAVDGDHGGPGGVEFLKLCTEHFADRAAKRQAGVRDLVAHAVHDDTGMVVVLLDHTFHVLLPLRIKMEGIVTGRLGDFPLVKTLVDHIQTQLVADIQKVFSSRVVGIADRIVAQFFQLSGSPHLRLIPGGGPQDAVVMVDTAAPQFHSFAVDLKPLVSVPCKGTDAKADVFAVIAILHMGSVEVRRFGAPRFGARDGEDEILSRTGHTLYGDSDGFGGLYANHSRLDALGGDFHAFRVDPILWPRPQIDRPVDAAAGIPPGVGAIGVIGNHTQHIILPDL